MMQRMKGTLRPGRKAGVLALAVLLLTCVLMAGAVSAADILVTSDDNLAEKIADATDGDVLILKSGEYNLPNGLKIEKAITLTAADANDKPKLTVPLGLSSGSTYVGIWVAAAGVKLDNLSITSTGGSGNQNAVIFVQFSSGNDPVEITCSEITTTLTETSAVRGIEISTQCPAPVKITGNTFQSTDSNLAAAIFSNPRSGIQDMINYNIFAGKYAALVGYDEGEGSISPDVRYNYWGPTIPDDAFPETITEYVPYYTALNDDGTIKIDSLTYVASITRDGETTYYGSIPDALDAAVDGDTIKIAPGEYAYDSLTIDNSVTIKAENPSDKPVITLSSQTNGVVSSLFCINTGDVTLENLIIEGTQQNKAVVGILNGARSGTVTIQDCDIVVDGCNYGLTADAGAYVDIIFTGNTITSKDGNPLPNMAIYINGYDQTYVFQNNIIEKSVAKQFGFDLYPDYDLPEPVDISNNFWGGEAPSIDDSIESYLTGQNVYYTKLNDDGTIDEGSLVYGEGALQDLIDNAENGATLELAGGEYSCPTGLVIDKDITITAADPSNMPKIVISGSPNYGHVGSVQIGVKNVKLSYLSFTTTQDQLFYVQDGSDPTKTVTIDHCYAEIPDGTGHFYGDYAGTECNIVLTNNKVESEGTPNLAIYFNVNAKSTYTIEKNIFPKCNHKQVGITVYSDDHAPVDISENYWGESEPTFECFVMEGNEAMPAEADDAGLSGQDTYYSRLNSDGTIDESSLVSPVEPTPQPTPLPPSYSSSSGNMENAYRVLFNDGSTTLTVQTDLSSGDKLTKPETPVKDGYTFAGWYKDSACTQAWDFETGIPGDMTLYAKWTAAGSSGETEATATPTKTQTAVTTPQPTKTQTAAATTSAPEATTAAGVSPTLTQAPTPVAGALFGLLAAGVLLRRRFQ